MEIKDNVATLTMQQRHDVEAKWENSNYIPLKGEIIIYDVDETHSYERLKIGDGNKIVSELPFIDNYYNNTPMLVDIGGIKASEHPTGFNTSIQDVLDELLYPYVPPTVVFTSDTNLVLRAGMTHTLEFNYDISEKSSNIISVKLYEGTKEVKDLNTTLDGDITLEDIKVTDPEKITYTLKVEDNKNKIVEKSLTFDFVYPTVYGFYNETEYLSIVELSAEKNHTFEYINKDTEKQKQPFVGYPATYGTLKYIIDENNFNQKWTCIEDYKMKIDTVDGSTEVVYILYMGDPSYVQNATYTFKFN